jgi:hypothetical protein
MRARLDVSEIEAQTKIRAKYLRALENEEWSLLPGPTFVKSFLRTYAQALKLDGRALVEEYRLHHERPSEGAFDPIASTPQRTRQRPPGSGPSLGYMVSVGVVGVVIVLLIVLLVSGGGSSKNAKGSSKGVAVKKHATHSSHPGATATTGAGTSSQLALVAVSFKPTAEVYVCLIGDNGRKLIPGTLLAAGVSTPTYRARRFQMTLGNNALTMYVDGRPRSVPSSSQAIGYSLTKTNGRRRLSAGELPTCK